MPKIKTHSGAKKRFKITKNGKVIRSVHQLQPGDEITTHLADGNVRSITV